MARNPIIRDHSIEVPLPTPDETPHACIGGWVFLGFEVEDENSEHVERLLVLKFALCILFVKADLCAMRRQCTRSVLQLN